MNTLSFGSALCALSFCAGAALAHGGGPSHDGDDPGHDVFTQVFQVRKATAAFQRLDNALAAGYARFQGCVEEPGEGGMGTHFVHGDLVADTVIDALRPEALMFETSHNGKMRLVGVEYIVFQEAWDAENAAPPTLFGETFALVPSPNRYGIPAFYELHAWVWQHNPYGMFEDWNPRVSCTPRHGGLLRQPF
jgi:hypothetical protein